jgi:Uma2 family endonuclease
MVLLDPSLVRPLKRAEYDKLVALGVFEDERVELLRGTVVRMSPVGPPHEYAKERATAVFVRALHPRASVRVESAFAASERSQPQPDLAIVPPRRYAEEHPARAHLVIEISQSSLSIDRNIKSAIYAEAGVQEYWVVNLVDDVIEVSTAPKAGAYTTTTLHRKGGTITLVAFPDVTIAVDDILP